MPFKTTTTTKELNQNGNSLQLQRVNDLIENKTKELKILENRLDCKRHKNYRSIASSINKNIG